MRKSKGFFLLFSTGFWLESLSQFLFLMEAIFVIICHVTKISSLQSGTEYLRDENFPSFAGISPCRDGTKNVPNAPPYALYRSEPCKAWIQNELRGNNSRLKEFCSVTDKCYFFNFVLCLKQYFDKIWQLFLTNYAFTTTLSLTWLTSRHFFSSVICTYFLHHLLWFSTLPFLEA